jgi:hypothetical protein
MAAPRLGRTCAAIFILVGERAAGHKWVRFFSDQSQAANPMPGGGFVFSSWQRAADRTGLALFFQAQPRRAGGIAPKCSLCFFKLAEEPPTARVWLCFFRPNHDGQAVLHQSAALFFQVQSIQAGCRAGGSFFRAQPLAGSIAREWHCLFRSAIPEQAAAEPQGLALFILALILPLY